MFCYLLSSVASRSFFSAFSHLCFTVLAELYSWSVVMSVYIIDFIIAIPEMLGMHRLFLVAEVIKGFPQTRI